MTIVKSQTPGTIEPTSEKISQLKTEISRRSADIQNLTSALETLQAGKSRPVDPLSDDAFSLLRELVGSAPQKLEERQIYESKLKAARETLRLSIEICEQKRAELKTLEQENRHEQADALLQELLTKAQEFNTAIDSSFALLEEMQSLNSQIVRLRGDRLQVFEVRSDLSEASYCEVGSNRVVLRRRFDLRRG
jgi:DNA repair exonuclease SbcCD ATPase subunit